MGEEKEKIEVIGKATEIFMQMDVVDIIDALILSLQIYKEKILRLNIGDVRDD